MPKTSWLRRLAGRKNRVDRGRSRRKDQFRERFAATLAIKPLESRLVLNATTLDLTSGVLTLTDTTPFQNDQLTIAADAANQRYIITDNFSGGTISLTANATTNGVVLASANSAYVPFNKITSTAAGAITVNTADGNDTLTIDLANGDLLHNVTFNGGNPTTSPGDALVLVGGPTRVQSSVTHTPTTAADGTINVVSGASVSRTVTYTGLEPITDGLFAANRTFQFTNTAETITFQDAGTATDGFNFIDSPLSEAITFRMPTTSLTINAGNTLTDTADDVVLVNRLDDAGVPTGGIQINGGGGNNTLTITTSDRANPTNVYSFAGYAFDQTGTFDKAAKLAAGDYSGAQITTDTGSATGAVNFPEPSTTGFLDALTIGRLLDPAATTGSRALNIPEGNVGTVVRSGIELAFNDTTKGLADQAGDDFVVYESSDFADFDGYMVQVHEKGGGWSRWRYESPDNRQAYTGSAATGAYATAFDIASFLGAGKTIDAIRIAGLTAADRIEGQGVETTVGSGVYRGQGFVLPGDNGLTSDNFPDPGSFASFTFFGNNTFDADPLYVGMLHPLATASNLRADTIEIQGDQVRLVAPTALTFTHAGFSGAASSVTVNSAGGSDTLTVNLNGVLPTNLTLNGGDPNGDVLKIIGNTTAVDTLLLSGAKITAGGTTLNLAALERLEINTAGDTNVDRITIKRDFALAGTAPAIQINGDATFDELLVDTEAPPAAPSGASFTAAGVTFYQDATPNQYAVNPVGALAGGFGVSVTTTSVTTNSLTGFPESGTGTFDAALSTGRLAAGGTGVRRLNLAGGNNRNVFTLNWSGGRVLEDQAGADIVIYEQGTAKTVAGGGPEGFMIQVHDPDSNTWSQWRYQQVTAQTTPDGAATTRFATVFDLQQFVTTNFTLASGRVDAIRVANLLTGDRVSEATGDGFVYAAGTPEAAGGFVPVVPAAFSTYTTFTAGTLTPDIVYVGVTHALAAPQPQGTPDIVNLDADSVDVVGMIPIAYSGLNRITLDTKGGADQITAAPSAVTAYTINAGDPSLPTNPTDRVVFNLAGSPGAVLTVTDPGAGTLVTPGRREILITGADSFGVPAGPATPTKFDVVIDSDSASAAAVNDTFTIDRDGALTRATVNGEIVFRGDKVGIGILTVNGDVTGETDNDNLTVDWAGDDPIPTGGLVFNGGGGTNQLTLQNGVLETITHTASLIAGAGRIDFDHFASNKAGVLTNLRSTIQYTGLAAPIRDELLTKQRVFEFTSANDDVQILDATGAGRSRVINRSPANTFVDVEFLNPTVALTLNGAAGNDAFGLEGIDPLFGAAINLSGGAGNDTFRLGGAGSVAFVKFPVNVYGDASGAPADPTQTDRLFIDDSADLDGSSFGVTETTIGGKDLPSGAATGNTTPTIDGSAVEWANLPVAFDTGARPGINQQTILHWLTVDGSGRFLNDDSPNNNDGALFPGQVAGVFGNALEFDGVDDYAWFQDPTFDVGAEGTLNLWVNMDSVSRRMSFLNSSTAFPGNGMEFEFRENNDGELFAYLNKRDLSDDSLILQNGTGAVDFPDTPGQWVNVQYTWDFLDEGTNTVIERAAIYVNGNQVAYRAGFGDPVTNWNQTLNTINLLMQLGRHRTENRFFDGRMDDVAIFNKALTQAELDTIRLNGVGAAQTNFGGVYNATANGGRLVAFWNFDQTAGQNVLAGNGGTTIALNVEKIAGGVQFIPNGGPTPPSAAGPLNAVEFDGNEDAIRVPDSASLDFNKSQGTIAFWINPVAQQARDSLAGNSTTLFEDSTGQIEIGISWQTDGAATLDHADLYGRVFLALKGNSPNEPTNIFVSDSRLTFSDWTHVAITWQTVGGQPQAKVYFNGQDDGFLLNRLNATNLGAVNTGDWTVGGDAATTPLNRWFEGRLADISIWGSALSAERVQHTFAFGAATSNEWDYAGASAKFAWDATNLYGLVQSKAAGPGAANGDFSDLAVSIFDANGVLLRTISVGTPNGATIAPAGTTGTYEFAIPFALLGGFDPNSTSFLQYTIRTRDADTAAGGFDSGLTTLGFVTPPLAGTTPTLAKLNFTSNETLFGVGGRVTYHGLADLDLRTGGGVDNVTLYDDPRVTNDPTANPAVSFTLTTGAGADNVTIASLDARYRAQTTIRTNADPLNPGSDGVDTITQLTTFNLGKTFDPRPNGELWLEADQIRLDAGSNTQGQIKLDGAVTILSDVRLSTVFEGAPGSDVWFTNFATIDSETGEANNLTLDTLAGRVLFNNNLGSAAGGELGRLIIERAAEVIFGQANTANPATGQGPVSLVRVTGDGASANGIDLGSLAVIAGGITFNGGVGNQITLQTTGDAIRVNGAAKLATNTTFDTDSTNAEGGVIEFTSAAPIDSATPRNVTFDAGTANILFSANLGGLNPLGAITVEEADGGVTFGATAAVTTVNATGAVNIGVGTNVIGGTGITFNGGATGFTLTTTDQNVRLNGAVTLQSNVRLDTGSVGAGDIVFTANSPVNSPGQPRDLILNAGTGAVEFNANLGATDRLKKLTVELARTIIFGGGDTAVVGGVGPVTSVQTDDAINLGSLGVVTDGIIFNGGAAELVVSTTGDLIRVNGATTLNSDTLFVTAGGDLLFTLAATIDSQSSEANNLVIDAAGGTVRFNNNVGAAANGALGRLDVQSAASVIFGEANSPAAGQGPVTLIRVTGDGSANAGVDLGSVTAVANIIFNGGVGDQFRIESTGDAIRVNGGTQFATNVTLDTDTTDNNTQGGNITFTSAAPINSAGAKNFTLDAGTAAIFFSANLGAVQPLGAITVEEADGGVTFGATAAVTTVNATGAVNIGVGTNVIGGTGITFNGGATGFTLTTTDQNVRLNGAVTLQSNVRLDTGSVGAGDIVFTADSPVNSPGQPHDLILNAGTGAVEFNANLGATDRLKKLTVELARTIIFGGGDTAVVGGVGPVTSVRTDDAINLGSLGVVTDGIIFNGGAAELVVSTTGDLIRVNGATTLQSDVRFDSAGGDVTFTASASLDSDPAGGNSFTVSAGAGDVQFLAAVGVTNALNNLTILTADDVLLAGLLQTTGSVTQSAGTGLTRFNGTTGGGIGGTLDLATNRVEFGTQDVVTVGAVVVRTQNELRFLTNAGLNATASTITLQVNLNGGPEGLTQDSTALIQTTNDTTAAIAITVGGTGDARISRLQTGTVAGVITLNVGGAIVDNRANEDANLTAFLADLTAGAGIGSFPNDLDTNLAFVTAFTTTQDIVLDEVNNLILRNMTAFAGTINVNTGGLLFIQNGQVLQSATGKASNAPPLLTLAENNPNDVLLPGDPTQEVRGQIGAGGLNAGNLEFGENFTIVVRWDDGVVSTLGGLKAGDNVTWLVDANNNSTVTITPGAAPGPIDIFIQRTYPLAYLQLTNKTDVTATFTLFNDARIQLNDATAVNLNQTVPFDIASAISKKDFGPPVQFVALEQEVVFEEPPPPPLLETPPLVPVQQVVFRQDLLLEEKKEEEEAVLFLVRVGADDEEGKRVRLPLDDLRDLARLLERLKTVPMPSGLYRIYHQEPGLPPRKVLEFRKAGNMIGDPVREPGRGANPIEEPAQGTATEKPPQEKPANPGEESNPNGAANDARQASLEAALREATAESFTRSARLRRRGS